MAELHYYYYTSLALLYILIAYHLLLTAKSTKESQRIAKALRLFAIVLGVLCGSLNLLNKVLNDAVSDTTNDDSSN